MKRLIEEFRYRLSHRLRRWAALASGESYFDGWYGVRGNRAEMLREAIEAPLIYEVCCGDVTEERKDEINGMIDAIEELAKLAGANSYQPTQKEWEDANARR